MANTLADTLDALLLKGVGDRRLLEQIRRAAGRREAISLNEREYVEQLRREHLDPSPVRTRAAPAAPAEPRRAELAAEAPRARRRRPGKKLAVVAAVAAAALAAGAYAALGGAVLSAPLSVGLDGSSYARGDIIAIAGDSDGEGPTVNVYVSDSSGRVIWSEEAQLMPDGSFSTLVISGGPGWGGPGEYEVVAAHGELVGSASFELRG